MFAHADVKEFHMYGWPALQATLAGGRETESEHIKALFSSLSSGDGWGEGGSATSLRLANGALD